MLLHGGTSFAGLRLPNGSFQKLPLPFSSPPFPAQLFWRLWPHACLPTRCKTLVVTPAHS